MKFNIFGSSNSNDYNIMYEFFEPFNPDYIPRDIWWLQDKEKNINYCTIEDGVISKIYKGLMDEYNNAIYYTYDLHKQYHPILTDCLLPRDKPAKINRMVKTIYRYIGRTRPEQGSIIEFELLKSIDFDKIRIPSPKYNRQKIAFQLVQTLALIDGYELYTKHDCADYMEILATTIFDGNSNESLNIPKNICFREIERNFNIADIFK